MESLFGNIGTIVISYRILYGVTLIGTLTAIIGGVVSLYILPEAGGFGTRHCKNEAAEVQMLTQWMLYSNVVGLTSLAMFIHGFKGTPISIIGSIAWILNFLQGIVLFFYAQATVFSSDVLSCASASAKSDSQTSLKW